MLDAMENIAKGMLTKWLLQKMFKANTPTFYSPSYFSSSFGKPNF